MPSTRHIPPLVEAEGSGTLVGIAGPVKGAILALDSKELSIGPGKSSSGWSYFPILYVRSPAAFLDDSIFSPPLLPRMLTKPRTVCGCQPVAFMISESVAPFARFIISMTSAFLFVRSAFGFPAAFLVRPAFFAGLAFLPALRPSLGFAASVAGLLMFSLSIAFSLIEFLLDRVAVVTVITPVGRKSKRN